MSILSLVMERDFGANKEGDVVPVDSELAKHLVECGVAREATEDDLGTSDEDEPEEDKDEEEGGAEVQDQLRSLSQNTRDTVIKATKQAVEQLTKKATRPDYSLGKDGAGKHIAGSDEARTGGFKSMGDAVHHFMRKSKGDLDSAKKFSRWENVVRTKGYMSVTGGSGHAGGDLVPQEWASDAFKLAFKNVPNLHGMMTQYPMVNEVLNLPTWVQSAGAAGVQANVISEGSTITDTQGVTANVQLTLVKGAILVNVTDELLRFNSYALDSILNSIFPERMRFLVNNSVVTGSNGQINLVGNASALTQIAEVPGHISYNDITGMYAKLFDGMADDAVWLINQSSSPELFGLGFPNRAATTQFPAFTPGWIGDNNLLGPKPLGNLMGRPVYMIENIPGLGSRGALMLWSPNSCAGAAVGGFGDNTPYLYFSLAQESFRFLYYFGSANRLNTPYVRADGSKASNIIVLSAGSTSSS